MGGFNPLCNSKINKVLRDGGAGYTKVKTEVIFPKTTAQFLDADMGINNYYYDIGTITLESGVEYWVTWDDAVYACVAYVSSNKVVLGDENILWGESGGVPFFVTTLGSSTSSIFTLENKEHTFCITQKTETIHPINPKYLPEGIGGGLPVIEISSKSEGGFWDENGGDLTAEEAAAFDAAVSAKTPIIVHTANGCAILCALDNTGGYTGALFSIADQLIIIIEFRKTNGVWGGRYGYGSLASEV